MIAEGALADLILVDGNLIQNLELITEPEKKHPAGHKGRSNLQKHPEVKL